MSDSEKQPEEKAEVVEKKILGINTVFLTRGVYLLNLVVVPGVISPRDNLIVHLEMFFPIKYIL